MFVQYYYFYQGPQQSQHIALLLASAERHGATCVVEPDQDGAGVTMTAPDKGARLDAWVSGIAALWPEPWTTE